MAVTTAQLFGIVLGSIPANQPLPCDVFVMVGDRPILLRAAGDSLTPARLKSLRDHGAKKLFIRLEERQRFYDFVWGRLLDPSTDEDRHATARQAGVLLAEAIFSEEPLQPNLQKSMDYAKKTSQLTGPEHWPAVGRLMVVESPDQYAHHHAVNVSALATELTARLYGKNHELVWKAGMAGFLHDIGERVIEPALLAKTEPVSTTEFQEIQRHPQLGGEFLKQLDSVPPEVILAVQQHHENADGTGYPAGLAGEGISILAKILSLCDVYDALVSDRPTRQKLSGGEAVQLMESLQGKKFDSTLFVLFRGLVAGSER